MDRYDALAMGPPIALIFAAAWMFLGLTEMLTAAVMAVLIFEGLTLAMKWFDYCIELRYRAEDKGRRIRD